MITSYEKCTGCGLCIDICPQNAISMEKLYKSHYYPEINTELCINCNLCKTNCPCQSQSYSFNTDIQKCYAIMASDNIRQKSSSGGAFYLLAESILRDDGIVFGAAFENNINHHTYVENIDEIEKLCTSKYIKSSTDNIYSNVIENLKSRKVLFTGTPCQVNALKKIVPKELDDNLYTIDILCMGVPSEYVFNKYIREEFAGEKIKSLNFRNKKNGWSYKLNLKIETNNGICELDWIDSSYFYLFLKSISLRDCCYKCNFANIKRTGDISLGDFWKIWEYDKKLDDRKGTSLVLINSLKGEHLLKKINPYIISEVPVPSAVFCNNALSVPTEKPVQRNDFLINLPKKELIKIKSDIINEKADCGIFNYWYANDHGAILTAYALQTFLYECGYTSRLINSCPESILPSRKGGISESFEKKHLSSTSEIYNSFEKCKKLNEKFDCFLVGSDQVFRAEWVPNSWFLGFCENNKGKMSISASFGSDTIVCSDERKKRIRDWLADFDFISVRESDAVDIMHSEFNLNSELIADPVFYINYDNLISESHINKTYDTIVYIRDMNDEISKMINRVTEDSILYINNNIEVIDFLYYFSKCKNVITDSYHGLCFALIFNKNIKCIVNHKRGASRFYSIKEQFRLPEEMFCEIDFVNEVKNIHRADYSKINYTIQEIVNKSRKMILNHLKNFFNH